MREGYSLRHNKYFCELHGFNSRVLFKYELTSLDASSKVKVVNNLRGKGKEKGIVEGNSGEWLANQVFTIPIDQEHIFSQFFINSKVKFKKFYVLIH